jgi:hypothetical protein
MSNEERVRLMEAQLEATEELAKALMSAREAQATLARLMEARGNAQQKDPRKNTNSSRRVPAE